MEKRNVITKTMAITGTVLTALPVLAPLVFSVFALFTRRRFLFDFLMPAEWFIVVALGGALLLWAALRARLRVRWIAWSVGLVIGTLFAGMGVASLSGLSTGAIESEGIWFILALAAFILYDLGVVSLAINGVLLSRDLSRPAGQPA